MNKGGECMGNFSFLRADITLKRANIVEGDSISLLIPKEFGGGSIDSYYLGYGRLGNKEMGKEEYDLYEVIAFWNAECKILDTGDDEILNELKYNGEFPNVKRIDEFTDYNRDFGIEISPHLPGMGNIKYPIKLVSKNYAKHHTYEGCPYQSYGDTEQGAFRYNWDELSDRYGMYFLRHGLVELVKGRVEYLKSQGLKKPNDVKEYETLLKIVDACEQAKPEPWEQYYDDDGRLNEKADDLIRRAEKLLEECENEKENNGVS